MFGVLQRFRVPSQLVVYPRTGHGVEEPLLREDSFERNLAWFDHWVLGRGADPMARDRQ
jgi:dipeptidyl aminopeptidase/acylaminoacyl peptidase